MIDLCVNHSIEEKVPVVEESPYIAITAGESASKPEEDEPAVPIEKEEGGEEPAGETQPKEEEFGWIGEVSDEEPTEEISNVASAVEATLRLQSGTGGEEEEEEEEDEEDEEEEDEEEDDENDEEEELKINHEEIDDIDAAVMEEAAKVVKEAMKAVASFFEDDDDDDDESDNDGI